MNRINIILIICIIIFFIYFFIVPIKSSNKKNNTEIKNNKLVVYYAPWCRYSIEFLEEWNKNLLPAVKNASDINTKVIFEAINCDENKEICNKIEGYPTIILYTSDGNVNEYTGERTTEEILKYVRGYL